MSEKQTVRLGVGGPVGSGKTALVDALCKLYPDPKRRSSLRVVAMVSMGTWRLALQAWREERGKRPFVECLRRQFATLEEEI